MKTGVVAEYWGESARNGYKRGCEHLKSLKDRCEKAPLWRHAERYHRGDQDPSFYEMKVQRSHRTPMARQIEEGVEILNSKANVIMNAKGEWNGSKLPSLLVERGDKIEQEKNDPYDRMWKCDKSNRWEINAAQFKKRKGYEEVCDVVNDSDVS